MGMLLACDWSYQLTLSLACFLQASTIALTIRDRAAGLTYMWGDVCGMLLAMYYM